MRTDATRELRRSSKPSRVPQAVERFRGRFRQRHANLGAEAIGVIVKVGVGADLMRENSFEKLRPEPAVRGRLDARAVLLAPLEAKCRPSAFVRDAPPDLDRTAEDGKGAVLHGI